MQRYKNGKSNYVSSYDIMSYDDANIILVESYSCNTKNELLVREKYWQDKLNCINKNNAIGHDHNASVQKYYNTNKEKISEYKKQHYLKKKQQNITV
jgi:DNA polymerase sigma